MVKQDVAVVTESNTTLKLMLMFVPAILAVAILIIGVAPYKDILGKDYWMLYWIGMPLIIYLLSTVSCLLAQYTTCNSINMSAVLLGSKNVLIYIYGSLLISDIAAFRAPVLSLIPYEGLKGINDILTIEDMKKGEFIKEKAVAYWLFWGTLIGQMSAIGTSTICRS